MQRYVAFLRSAKEIAAIAAREPFDAKAVAHSKGRLQEIAKLLGTDTRRTMGTIEQIAAKLG